MSEDRDMNNQNELETSIEEQVVEDKEETELEQPLDIEEPAGNDEEDIISGQEVKRKPKINRVAAIVIAAICLCGLVACVYGTYALNLIKYENAEDIELMDETFDEDEKTENLEDTDIAVTWETEEKTEYTEVEGVYNILLCGVEAIGGGRGRTDCIMIATINTYQNSIKLTSLMRDTYVKIKGYSNNKLNASYQQGGMPLLLDTVESNFDVKIDGYVMVNFDGFEKVIDALGGVEIELSEKEAKYLNKTNYISKKENRNLVAGKQVLNGNQALGYSRVRYVATPNGLHDDYGRNYRQRTVLSAVFNKYKSKNIVDIVALMPQVLELVTTNLSRTDIIKYATTILGMNVDEIETYRVPMEGVYKGGYVRKMSVLYITDIVELRHQLHVFLYGEEKAEELKINSLNYYNEATGVSSKPVSDSKPTSTPTPEIKVEEKKKDKDTAKVKDKETKKVEDVTVSPTPVQEDIINEHVVEQTNTLVPTEEPIELAPIEQTEGAEVTSSSEMNNTEQLLGANENKD